ncbi:MAG: hypothetical protein H0T89_24905 [Deltaproteobacteria bacterium]|nr:hypothetical protein [Deltaproteobacteria bacterium]MDQ3299489.1 hypothetical protein [Myxococcota bacterium]
MRTIAATSLIVLALCARSSLSVAAPRTAPVLVALAPPPGDDARRAVPIGPAGQVFEPDGKGAWIRRTQFATADTISVAGRAGTTTVALGEGIVYRLAPNGWSALRIMQRGKAVMSAGPRAVAAVGRQLFALDRTQAGEPVRLGIAPDNVLALGAGKTTVIQTARGLFRIDGARVVPIKKAPRHANKLVGDRWALVDHGVVDLRTGKTTTWPAGLAVMACTLGADDRLVAVASVRGGLELVTLHQNKVERAPIEIVPVPTVALGTAVGVAVDKAGRAVVALRDGRLAVRERGAWSLTNVVDELPVARPGPAPALSH